MLVVPTVGWNGRRPLTYVGGYSPVGQPDHGAQR